MFWLIGAVQWNPIWWKEEVSEKMQFAAPYTHTRFAQ